MHSCTTLFNVLTGDADDFTKNLNVRHCELQRCNVVVFNLLIIIGIFIAKLLTMTRLVTLCEAINAPYRFLIGFTRITQPAPP